MGNWHDGTYYSESGNKLGFVKPVFNNKGKWLGACKNGESDHLMSYSDAKEFMEKNHKK